MKKFLLINAPTEIIDIPSYTFLYPPNGILSIAAYLQKKSHELSLEINIYDMYSGNHDEIIEKISSDKPDYIGIGVLTPAYKNIQDLCKKIKSKFPWIIIILGGVHPTLFPAETLQNNFVDFIVQGEGEKTLYDFFMAQKENRELYDIQSLGYKKNEKVFINSRRTSFIDLNELDPLPYELVDIEKYLQYSEKKSGYRALGIVASRGCIYKCEFCVDGNHKRFINSWRSFSPEKLVNDIEQYIEKFNLGGIWFKDSTFTINRKWTNEFCDTLLKRNLNIKWSCNTRVNTVDETILEKMSAAGCETIWFGIESGSEKILKLLKKQIDVEKTMEVFRLCGKFNIRAWANFMLGTPTETREDIELTFNFAKKLSTLSNVDNIHLTIYTPFPGTPLYERYHNDDFIFTLPPEALTYEKASIDTGHLTKAEVEMYYNMMCKYFYNSGKSQENNSLSLKL